MLIPRITINIISNYVVEFKINYYLFYPNISVRLFSDYLMLIFLQKKVEFEIKYLIYILIFRPVCRHSINFYLISNSLVYNTTMAKNHFLKHGSFQNV